MSDDNELLETIKKRFKLACDVESEQRQREEEDLRFQVPEYQWTEAAIRERRGDGVTPGRPTLSVSKLDQPLQLVFNQERSAQLGVNVDPISEDANYETAEIIQGLYRDIERDSQAYLARSWAFQRAAIAGRGAYRVSTEYDDRSDHLFDQKIVIKRILHQETVYFDPTAVNPDYSDGKWAFVVAWVPIDDFVSQYGAAASELAGNLSDFMEHEPDWVRHTDGGNSVLIAEYFHKEYTTRGIALLEDQSVVSVDDVRGRKVLAEREIEDVSLKWVKVSAAGVLERGDFNGKLIPLIPTIGRELLPLNGSRRWIGMIHNAKDAQRFFNHSLSNFTERMSAEPKTPWVMAVGQDAGYESEWQFSNIRNMPVLHYVPTSVNGQLLSEPHRVQLDQTGMSMAMMAIQEADGLIQSSTATFDPSLGKLPQRERSGKAILALQKQAEVGTSHYLQNLADISMTYEARVILGLMPEIYDRPGRVARILRGDDNRSEAVILNSPFVVDKRTGRPQVVDGSVSGAKIYDLRAGTYSVSLDIGKSYKTRVQEGTNELGELLTARPELMPILGDIYFKFLDMPGSKEISERLRRLRERQFPGIGEGEDSQFSPDQAKAQIQAAQQQIQALEAQLQQITQIMEKDVVKAKAQMAKAEMDNATKEKIASMELQVRLAIEDMRNRMAAMEGMNQRGHEMNKSREGMAHEFAMSTMPKGMGEGMMSAPDLTFRGPNDLPLDQDD